MQNRTKLLIIGGYGNVGNHIVSLLDETGNFTISICGRDFEKAKKVAAKFNENVIPYKLDASDFFNHTEFIREHDIILSCIDLKSNELPKYVLENGKVFLDLTANYDFMHRVRKLSDVAKDNGGSAIFCVGLVPGLSNLMVKHLVESTKEVVKAEIFVQLGLGDKNGKAAIRWILDNILSDYSIMSQGRSIQKTPFRNGQIEEMPGKQGRFYPFNLADQHVVYETLNLTEAISYLGFDLQWFTRLISFLKGTRLLNILRISICYRLMVWLIMNVRFGKSIFTIKVKVTTTANEQKSIYVTGNEEAIVTAQVACELISRLAFNRNRLNSGVTFIENHLQLEDVIKKLDCKFIEEV